MVSYSSNGPPGFPQVNGVEIPLFQQVARRISDDIVAGILVEDAQVPSTTEFAIHWSINPATALKGITQLVDDGILYKQRGIGMFVAEGARERLLAQRRTEFADRFVHPLLAEAGRIGLTPTEVAHLILKENRHDQ
ncbi:MAG: GntR family transcriptional regulator [Propionibacteriaceae bacterium]|nr:GntR family transcriptional regulator [Propionibacteriaceae bacterium]